MHTKSYRDNYYQRNREKIIAQTIARRNKRTPERKLLDRAKERAAFYGKSFDLVEADITIPNTCPILGIEMSAPSIDRLDNSGGYVKGNVWVISQRANWLKKDATLDELRKMAEYFGRND